VSAEATAEGPSEIPAGAATRGRLALARRLVPAYAAEPRVRAVAVTGSVARGWADRYSDVELGVFWDAAPTDAERRALVARAGGDLWHLFPPDDVGRWGEDYYVARVKIDVGNATVGAAERWLTDVVERHETALQQQHFAAAVLHAVPLHGAPLIAAWHARLCPYPEALRRAMVRRYLRFNPIWGPEMLADRGEVLVLHEYLAASGRKLLAVLAGLNGIYHPGNKWVDRLIAELAIAPPNLAERLRRLFLAPARAGVEAYRELTEEVFDLVERHLSDVDTAEARAFFRHRRPLVEDPLPDELPPGAGSVWRPPAAT
jgi:hypothetical protein